MRANPLLALALMSCLRGDAAQTVADQGPGHDDDGDGFSEDQGDCDDASREVYPGALDRERDGVDMDCNGADYPASAAEADVVIYGDDTDDKLDNFVAMDLDNDDELDLVVTRSNDEDGAGSSGLYVFYGPLDQSPYKLGDADAHIVFEKDDKAGLGGLEDIGDLSRDGLRDLAVSAYGYDSDEATNIGAVFLVRGSAVKWDGEVELDDAVFATIFGDGQGHYLARSVLGPGNITGDDQPDLLLGNHDGVEQNAAGAVWGLAGPLSGDIYLDLDLNEATFVHEGHWVGPKPGVPDRVGFGLVAGDFDGDGEPDYAVSPREGGVQGLSCFAVLGEYDTNGKVGDLGVRLKDTDGIGACGGGMAVGDLDDDDHDDLLLGASAPFIVGAKGALHMVSGTTMNVGKVSSVGDAGWTLEGTVSGGHLGAAVAVGDTNHDGLEDIAVGVPLAGEGTVLIYSLPSAVESSGTDLAPSMIQGVDDDDAFGTTIRYLGDFNGDGQDDLGIGAPNANDPLESTESNHGAVYIFFSG